MPTMAGTPPRVTDWRLVVAIEHLGSTQGTANKHVRLTLGDAALAFPWFTATGDASALRTALLQVLHASGTGFIEPGAQGEVVYCFPKATRAAVLAHGAGHRLVSWRRTAWRSLVVITKLVFTLWLIFSLLLAFLAVVAAAILALSQRGGGSDSRDVLPITTGFSGGGGGGGGGGPGYRGDPFMDLYWCATPPGRDVSIPMLGSHLQRQVPDDARSYVAVNMDGGGAIQRAAKTSDDAGPIRRGCQAECAATSCWWPRRPWRPWRR